MAVLSRLVCAGLLFAVPLASEPSLEYQVKAAFLYNFARFTKWPPEALATTSSIGICVLGQDPFKSALEQTFRDKAVNGRSFVIRRLMDTGALGECHILFFGSPDMAVPAVLRNASQAHILTVGESPGFIKAGGMVEFVLSANKVRFKVNAAAALRAHILLSAQLLQLAWLVDPPKGAGH